MLLEIRQIEKALGKAPAIRPFLERMARKAMSGKRLPQSFTAGPMDYVSQRELENLLGTRCGRQPDGKIYGSLMASLRVAGEWRTVSDVLGVEARTAFDRKECFVRMSWTYPEYRNELGMLESRHEVSFFMNSVQKSEKWRRLFEGVCSRHRQENPRAVTLSQLGSDWFNDSKCLRSGALRDQLVIIAGVVGKLADRSERDVLNKFGIIDNPYTTYVTVFAPFIFKLADGLTFDFPERLFENGLACQLPLETVERMAAIEWRGSVRQIRTSENAAPFARMVAKREVALYTEGYPNAAVRGLLAQFADENVSAQHEGDADLDGFRIAAEIKKSIPVTRVVAAEVVRRGLERNDGILLDDAQKLRLENALKNDSDASYAESLLGLVNLGRWFEQESFDEKAAR
jgi:hypothetical protein